MNIDLEFDEIEVVEAKVVKLRRDRDRLLDTMPIGQSAELDGHLFALSIMDVTIRVHAKQLALAKAGTWSVWVDGWTPSDPAPWSETRRLVILARARALRFSVTRPSNRPL